MMCDIVDSGKIYEYSEVRITHVFSIVNGRRQSRNFISVCYQPPRSTRPSTLRGTVK